MSKCLVQVFVVLCSVWADFRQPASNFQFNAGHHLVPLQLSGVSCTRQASGFLCSFKGSSGASFGHLCKFRANLQISSPQLSLSADNIVRQHKIKEPSGTFCNGQSGPILSIESWSQLSTLRHSSDNMSPSGLSKGNS